MIFFGWCPDGKGGWLVRGDRNVPAGQVVTVRNRAGKVTEVVLGVQVDVGVYRWKPTDDPKERWRREHAEFNAVTERVVAKVKAAGGF